MSAELNVRRQRSAKGGRAVVAKYGSTHMSRIGKRGYAAALARYPDLAQRGGNASFRKQNLCQLEAGYYPNQSPQIWEYCQTPGCHRRQEPSSRLCAKCNQVVKEISVNQGNQL